MSHAAQIRKWCYKNRASLWTIFQFSSLLIRDLSAIPILKMIRFFLLLGLLSVTLAAPFQTSFDDLWETYKKVFEKKYNAFEEGARRLIWEKNVARVQRHNVEADLKKYGYKLGVNHFSDMGTEEFNIMNGLKIGNRTKRMSLFLAPSNVQYPTEVDWRNQGLVTEVKNQGKCGSCWAFSTTGSLEGQHKKQTGKLTSLSEQNLVDCATAEGNEGCDGGMMDSAFQYIKKNNGIDTEDSYPYIGKNGICHFRKQNVGATLTGWVDIPQGDEDALMKAVATVGPVSVAINAEGFGFQQYSHGVFDQPDCNPSALNHGVLAVGYGTEDGADFWLIKNSWSQEWGENGYIKMARNKNNQCGIASLASYPLV